MIITAKPQAGLINLGGLKAGSRRASKGLKASSLNIHSLGYPWVRVFLETVPQSPLDDQHHSQFKHCSTPKPRHSRRHSLLRWHIWQRRQQEGWGMRGGSGQLVHHCQIAPALSDPQTAATNRTTMRENTRMQDCNRILHSPARWDQWRR